MVRPDRFDSWPPRPSWTDRLSQALRVVSRGLMAVAFTCLRIAWRVVLFVVFTALVLAEPLVRIVLVPLATLSALMALVFGLMHAPHFHPWGMLAFGVGALWLYWLYLLVIHWILRGLS